jgi:hypothetical protein
MKNRESILLEHHLIKSLIDEDYEEYDENEILDFEYIKQKVSYTDIPKGYQNIDVIIKRTADNKYFKFTYCDSEYMCFDETNENIFAEEVFPKIVTKTTYI